MSSEIALTTKAAVEKLHQIYRIFSTIMQYNQHEETAEYNSLVEKLDLTLQELPITDSETEYLLGVMSQLYSDEQIS